MEKLSTRGSFDSRISCGMMSGLATILVVTLFTTGCHKARPPVAQAPEPPVVAASQSTAAVPQGPQYASTPVVIAADPAGGADLKQLNHAYIGWIVQNQRRPKNFDEYITLSGAQVPAPPAGKKYVIDKNGFINFANN